MIPEEPDVRTSQFPGGWYIASAIIISTFFAFLSITSGTSTGYEEIPPEKLGGVICLGLLLFHGLLLSIVFLSMNILGTREQTFSRELAMDEFSNRTALWGIGLGVVSLLLGAGILRITFYVMDSINLTIEESDPILDALAAIPFSTKALLTLLAITLIPITEELVFRLTIYCALRHVFPHFLSSLVSALVFASAHTSVTAFPMYVVFAMFLQEVFCRTRNLYYPIMMHSIFNLLMITLSIGG